MKIEVKALKKSFNKRVVLDVKHLEIGSGRSVALIGPNGAGKSTLLRILAGVEVKDGGTILYDGRDNGFSEEIAFQPQKPYVFGFSVKRNVQLGMKKSGISDDKAMEALKNVQMEAFEGIKATLLSGGEAQRVALARTLVMNKRLVLLDEPASAIDIPSIRLVEDYIKKVNLKNKATIIFSTHNPSQALRIADEVHMLWEGEIIESGIPEEVLKNPKDERVKLFLEDWNWRL